MRGTNLMLNAGTIFGIGMTVAWAIFFPPESSPWLWPVVILVCTVLVGTLVVRVVAEKRKHRRWLEDRVARARIALRDEPGDLERLEDLYEALSDLGRKWERLSALEAWAAADPEDKTVQRRLRELTAKLGQPPA